MPVRPRVSSLHRIACLLAVVATLVDALMPRGVSGQDAVPPETTTWAVKVAPDSRCRDRTSFLETLAAQIPPTQRVPEDQAELVAEVRVTRDRLAHIVVFDRVLLSEAGSRELPLTSRRCEKVAQAIALVIGVLVEAGRGALKKGVEQPAATALADPPEEPVPEAPVEEPPVEEPEPPPVLPSRATRPRPRARPVWRGPPAGHDLSVAPGVGYGLLPSFVPGLTVGWGIRPSGTWPIWLQGTGWLEATSGDQRGRFSAVYGGILTCPLVVARGPLRGRACPGLAVGALWAEGQGFVESIESRRPLILIGLEAAGTVRLVGPLEATLIARAEAVPIRSGFIYRRRDGSAGEIHRPSVVVGSLFGGLALRFR